MSESDDTTVLTIHQRPPSVWYGFIGGGLTAVLCACVASIAVRGFDAKTAQVLLGLCVMGTTLARYHTRTIRLTERHVCVGQMARVAVVSRTDVLGVTPKVLLTSTTRRPSRHGVALRGLFEESELTSLAKELGVPTFPR